MGEWKGVRGSRRLLHLLGGVSIPGVVVILTVLLSPQSADFTLLLEVLGPLLHSCLGECFSERTHRRRLKDAPEVWVFRPAAWRRHQSDQYHHCHYGNKPLVTPSDTSQPHWICMNRRVLESQFSFKHILGSCHTQTTNCKQNSSESASLLPRTINYLHSINCSFLWSIMATPFKSWPLSIHCSLTCETSW